MKFYVLVAVHPCIIL